MTACWQWAIFCRVVDNFGDAGVTWRLARQLAEEHDQSVCLWIDDLQVLHRLWPEVQPGIDVQHVAGVTIRRWRAEDMPMLDADVVIEAFACHLPEPALVPLAARTPKSVWLNLEYLSAEDWVTDCHGLPSLHPRLALAKYFFFPGFTEGTGGLLRESGLLAQRAAFAQDPLARPTFLANLGVEIEPGQRLVSLFCYDGPIVGAWLAALAHGDVPTLCLLPEGSAQASVAAWFGRDALAPGERHGRGALTLQVVPFLRQDSYDRLLWSCDFNVVRGEDSCLRAQWAGRPFAWHIYRQQDAAHLRKLEAFVQRYTAGLPLPLATDVRKLMLAGNGEDDLGRAWAALASQWPAWQAAAVDWCDRQAGRPDLAAELIRFCSARRAAVAGPAEVK